MAKSADQGGQSVTALPWCSDVDLLGNDERIIDLDAKISDGALHLGVPKEQLNHAEVAGPPVNQDRFGSPQRMGAEQGWVEADPDDPLR
jgi:hypothetical protein